MESHHPKKFNKQNTLLKDPTCTKTCCILCSMNEPHSLTRKTSIATCLKQLPLINNPDELLINLSGLWNIAVSQPDDREFPSLGIFECMVRLINKSISDKNWLMNGKNICVPYFAAHIIGSYTMNRSQFAELAVESGALLPLIELLKGNISWVEQRVAVRALGHIASHKRTFKAIAVYEEEIVKLAMKIASTCLETVFTAFLNVERNKRVAYHCDLISGGVKGSDTENRKAEEWAIQLQSWSLYIINCFVTNKMCINLICNQDFLKALCGMWGGLESRTSFAGIGLIRSLCLTQEGRANVAESEEIMKLLCNMSRSSDDWQLDSIYTLLLLLKDRDTRYKVMNVSIHFLIDLVELRSIKGRRKVGDRITQVILQDYSKIKYGQLVLHDERARKALDEIWFLKVEKRKREKLMSEQEFKERKLLVAMLKTEGNRKFLSGDIGEAVAKYTKALDLCPLKMQRERIVLFSNRAQCHLLLRQVDLAISDTTRALCLSGSVNPHVKSLWRRSQAYDMNGMARNSLMDCLMFINGRSRQRKGKHENVPPYAAYMLNKHMNATYVFSKFVNNAVGKNHEKEGSIIRDDDKKEPIRRKMQRLITRMATRAEEQLLQKVGRKSRRGKKTLLS